MQPFRSLIARRAAALTATGLLFLGGCDPTTRAIVEDGIITVSTSLLGALIQGFFQAANAA